MQPISTDEQKLILQELFGPDAEKRANSLSAYFRVYDSLTTSQIHHTVVQIQEPALKSHGDVIGLIRTLKENVQCTRDEIRSLAFPSLSAEPTTSADVDDAINVAVHALIMVDCAAKRDHSDAYEIDGFKPATWQNTERFADFVLRSFPSAHDKGHQRLCLTQEQKGSLKAWKLRKRAGVTFKPTDNLAEHLLYDQHDDTIRLFHHTAFLKAHLRMSATRPIDSGFEESLDMGSLPPQLLLETLSSLQYILFPHIDHKSTRFLENLVCSKDSTFDKDCLSFDGHIRQMPQDFEYQYWGARLLRLHDLVTHPKPRHRFALWLQRHTSERNALYVAILGLFLAAFFGLLSVVVGIVQTWIAYQAWKHPQAYSN